MKRLMAILFLASIFIGCQHKSDIPVFDLLLSDSTTVFNTAKIPEGKTTMIVFFNPACEYCQLETIDLINHMDVVKEIQIYYVSIDPLYKIKRFATFYELDKYHNVLIGKDISAAFPRLSGLHEIPSALIYDSDKRLRAKIKGGFDVHAVAEMVKKM